MSHPANFPLVLKWIRINFPNLEELSFLAVLAFPKDSKIGFVWTIWSSKDTFLEAFFSPLAPTSAKYEITFLVFSVLPAPDSPLKISLKNHFDYHSKLQKTDKNRSGKKFLLIWCRFTPKFVFIFFCCEHARSSDWLLPK